MRLDHARSILAEPRAGKTYSLKASSRRDMGMTVNRKCPLHGGITNLRDTEQACRFARPASRVLISRMTDIQSTIDYIIADVLRHPVASDAIDRLRREQGVDAEICKLPNNYNATTKVFNTGVTACPLTLEGKPLPSTVRGFDLQVTQEKAANRFNVVGTAGQGGDHRTPVGTFSVERDGTNGDDNYRFLISFIAKWLASAIQDLAADRQ